MTIATRMYNKIPTLKIHTAFIVLQPISPELLLYILLELLIQFNTIMLALFNKHVDS